MFGHNYCNADGPSIPEIIKIQPFHHKLWKNLFSEVGQCNFTAAKKAFFYHFLTQNRFLPWKWQTTMTNNLHHLKAGIKTVFLSLGLGYHHIQIIGLEFVQRCGHQIRVNTWTGSYSLEWLEWMEIADMAINSCKWL